MKITVDGLDYLIPIWDLELNVQPWSGIETPAQRGADGTNSQKIRGWHVYITFQMEFANNGINQCDASTAVYSMFETGSATIDLDPVDNEGDRTLTVVIDNADDAFRAVFNGGVRGRPFGLRLVTETAFANGAIPPWVAGDPAS